MNKEIKEIIEYFKDDINYLEEDLKYPNFKGRYITIRDKECEYLRKLLDYITNLQKENKRLIDYQESYRKELDYWKIQFSNKEDKINKAIEYIEARHIKAQVELTDREKELLNILRGEDNGNN